MELSEELQRGLHRLADPAQFSSKAFSTLLSGALQSLIRGPAAHTLLDETELQKIASSVVKECHAAISACILEAVRHNADRAALSTFLEDCRFDKERTEEFWTEYQKHKESLEILLENIGRCPPQVSDISWRLTYEIKTNQLYKTYRPSYLVNFSLEDLVGKLKDAAKSLERTSQM